MLGLLPYCFLPLIKDMLLMSCFGKESGNTLHVISLVVVVLLHIHPGPSGGSPPRLMLVTGGDAGQARMCVAFFLTSTSVASSLTSMGMTLNLNTFFFLTFRSYTTDVHCQTPTMHSCFCKINCCTLPDPAPHRVVYSLPSSPLFCRLHALLCPDFLFVAVLCGSVWALACSIRRPGISSFMVWFLAHKKSKGLLIYRLID
ncbi:hypothetical protein BO70DRAFT_26817 [Aspergillus heteromorphus CBS 117.55]|uniref:Uncharacterized protein n=1 Tax=Aspergillus heteromorphus CBS 117.55 TaxID=1448321 RepID=A0A317WAV0_9EURO|nr:uncharacterized protein BO70DRAFT_26817 [Aspergillus heteromorphus CBS 117.55]PWY83473.1 hypothetical protein BO70DRAFT_26817 [Aspergillus heteromorphus CBS 117.55]